MARAGITLTELAKRLGKSVSWVSDRVAGRIELKFDEACAIRDVIGVDMPLEELFARSPIDEAS